MKHYKIVFIVGVVLCWLSFAQMKLDVSSITFNATWIGGIICICTGFICEQIKSLKS